MVFRASLAAALFASTFLPVVARAADTAPPQRPPITGLAYVRFFEDDIPAARHFYATLLGLPSEPTSFKDVEAFAVGRSQSIQIAPRPAGASSYLAEVAFLTPDLPAMTRFLAAHHVAAIPEGPDAITTQDPEGNHITFVRQDRAAALKRSFPTPDTGKSGAPTSSRMIHAGFMVHSRDAENKFYLDLLGFKPYWYGGMHPDKVDWVSLQVPDGHDWIEYMLGAGLNPSKQTLGVLNHTSLGIETMQPVATQLTANGMTNANSGPSAPKTPEQAMQMGKDGKEQLNVFDPDQSRIEFMEFRPRETPCCSAPTAPPPSPADLP